MKQEGARSVDKEHGPSRRPQCSHSRVGVNAHSRSSMNEGDPGRSRVMHRLAMRVPPIGTASALARGRPIPNGGVLETPAKRGALLREAGAAETGAEAAQDFKRAESVPSTRLISWVPSAPVSVTSAFLKRAPLFAGVSSGTPHHSAASYRSTPGKCPGGTD